MSHLISDSGESFKVNAGRLFTNFGDGLRLYSKKNAAEQIWGRVRGNCIRIQTPGGPKEHRTVSRKDLEEFLRAQKFLPQETGEKIPKDLLQVAYEKFLKAKVLTHEKEVPTDTKISEVSISDTEVVGNRQQFESLFSELENAGFAIPETLSQTVKEQAGKEVRFSLADLAARLSTSEEKSGPSVLLYAACLHGSVAAVKPLLEMKADPNIIDNKGRAPLHIACQTGHHALFEPLILGGANPRLRDETHAGPAQYIDSDKFPSLTQAWFTALKGWKS